VLEIFCVKAIASCCIGRPGMVTLEAFAGLTSHAMPRNALLDLSSPSGNAIGRISRKGCDQKHWAGKPVKQ